MSKSGGTERTRTKVSDGWSRVETVLVRGTSRTDRLMIMDVWSKILRILCRERLIVKEGLVFYGGKLLTNSAVKRFVGNENVRCS